MQRKKNTGKPYELAVKAYLKEHFPGCEVTLDHKIQGVFGVEQIDVFVSVPVPFGEPMKIGVEAKHHGRPLTKDTFASIYLKFLSAKVNRGIIVCSTGIQSGVQERIEKLPFDFQVKVMTLEELTEGAWAKDFLSAIPRLRAAKSDENPSEHLVDMVVGSIKTHAHYAQYFFRDLTNLAWIPILSARSVFEEAATGESQLPQPLVADYLALGVVVFPQEFLRFCRALIDTHFWAIRSLVVASEKLAPEGQAEFFALATSWRSWFRVAVSECEVLIEREVRAGRSERAIAALEQVTVFDVERQLVAGRYEERALVSATDEDDFQNLVEDLLPRLASFEPEAFLPFAHRRLRDAVSGLYPEDGEIPAWKFNHVRSPDFLSREKLLGSLINSYVRCLISAGTDQGAFEKHCRAILEDEADLTSKRCVIYAISQLESVRREIASVVVQNENVWRQHLLIPELESLVELAWAEFTVAERRTIIATITESAQWSDQEDDGGNQWLVSDTARWLALLLTLSLDEESRAAIQKVFDPISAETGITERADRSERYGLIKASNHTPEAARSFVEMSVDDVLDFCISFQSHGEFPDEKTPYGLAPALQKEVQSRADQFLEAGIKVAKLPYPTYAAAVVNGLSASATENPEISIIGCCDIASDFLRREFVGHVATLRGTGTRQDVVFACARFVRDVSDQVDRILECAEVSEILEVSRQLAVDEETRNASLSDHVRSDAMFDALNSVDGSVALAICSLGARALRQLRMEDDLFPPALGNEVYAEVRQFLEQFIFGMKSARVRAALGSFFSVFWQWDREWATKCASRLFDLRDRESWIATWSTYLSRPRFTDALGIMRLQYVRTFEVLPRDSDWPNWGRAVARDIALMWFTEELSDQDELVERLLGSSKQLLSTASWQIGRYLVDSPEHDDRGIWLKAIVFWRKLSDASLALGTSVTAMILWLKDAPESVLAEDFEALILACAGCKDHHKHLIWPFLEFRAVREPECTARCLLALTSDMNGFITGPDINCIVAIIRHVHAAGDVASRAAVRAAAIALLKQGALGIEEIIGELD